MNSTEWREQVKPQLDAGQFELIKVIDDGTNLSNEIGLVQLHSTGELIIWKVMLTAKKYHQKRKALTEIVTVLLDEGLGGERITGRTYVGKFGPTEAYSRHWSDQPKEADRRRVCEVIHQWLPGIAGDEWRGRVYGMTGDLDRADAYCRGVIEGHPDAERMALIDLLTINQDRSARNWLTDNGKRFWAIDNGMAWFHTYPDSQEWRGGCVVDDVVIQNPPWRFISGIFATSYVGKPFSAGLLRQMNAFDWLNFRAGINKACRWLDLPLLADDWRFLGLERRFRWMASRCRFATRDEYRRWHSGSSLMTPPEIVDSGGKIVWVIGDDRE